jgi:hypothetical protein
VYGIETAATTEGAGQRRAIDPTAQVPVANTELSQHASGQSAFLMHEAKEQVLAVNMGSVLPLRLLPGELEHLLQPRGDREGRWPGVLPPAHKRLDGTTDMLEICSYCGEEPGGHTMLGAEQAQQKMFCADGGVVQGGRFLLGTGHRLPSIHVETVKEQPTRIFRLPARSALLLPAADQTPDETSLRCRRWHGSSSMDDLMNPLMTQVERVRDLPHGHAERMEPPDDLVVCHPLTLCIGLQSGELLPESACFA